MIKELSTETKLIIYWHSRSICFDHLVSCFIAQVLFFLSGHQVDPSARKGTFPKNREGAAAVTITSYHLSNMMNAC